jgi:hypothetical protein
MGKKESLKVVLRKTIKSQWLQKYPLKSNIGLSQNMIWEVQMKANIVMREVELPKTKRVVNWFN